MTFRVFQNKVEIAWRIVDAFKGRFGRIGHAKFDSFQDDKVLKRVPSWVAARKHVIEDHYLQQGKIRRTPSSVVWACMRVGAPERYIC